MTTVLSALVGQFITRESFIATSNLQIYSGPKIIVSLRSPTLASLMCRMHWIVQRREQEQERTIRH